MWPTQQVAFMMAAKHTARQRKKQAGNKATQMLQWPDNIPIQAGQALSMQSNAAAHFSSLKQAKMPSRDAEMVLLSAPSKPQLVRGCAAP